MAEKTITLNIVPRKDWDPHYEPRPQQPIESPIPRVLFTFTDTDTCKKKNKCIDVLDDLAGTHIAKRLPDIAYSFMIGSDGCVYEGRGWKVRPTITDPGVPMEDFDGKSLVIAYIGDFQDLNFPANEILKIKDELVRFGIREKYILDNFWEPYRWYPVRDYDHVKYDTFITAKLALKTEGAAASKYIEDQ